MSKTVPALPQRVKQQRAKRICDCRSAAERELLITLDLMNAHGEPPGLWDAIFRDDRDGWRFWRFFAEGHCEGELLLKIRQQRCAGIFQLRSGADEPRWGGPPGSPDCDFFVLEDVPMYRFVDGELSKRITQREARRLCAADMEAIQ